MMGITFGANGTLTESQQQKAKELGISYDEMKRRLLIKRGEWNFETSIIIPVYNGEKYIKECIMSVLKQTIWDYEVIVVDDGSTDKTLDIITQIDGITILVKNNGGTASALNMGIKNARGRWIHWLSADDVLYEDAIENMLEEINKIPNNDKHIYYTNYDIIDENGVIIREFIEPLHRNNSTKEERFKELLGNYYGNGSSSMIHRKVFDRIGYFNEALRFAEDYDFWLKLMKSDYDLRLIPIKTLKYRNHKDQLTNKMDISLVEVIRSKYR